VTGSEGQDWAGYQASKPPTAGLAFVIVKATEGTGFVNPKYTAQIATARAGVEVAGHYHFARPGSMTAQVTYFLAHTSIRPGDILAFDWEDTRVSSDDKDAWIKAVQAAMPHNQVGLYCNQDYWLHRDGSGFYGDFLWIADPSAPKGKPRIKANWLLHQYSDAGGIDRNYSPLTADQLDTWSHAKENDVAFTQADAKLLLDTTMDDPTKPGAAKVTVRGALWAAYGQAAAANAAAQKSAAQVTALSATVHTLAGLVGSGVDTAAVVEAVEAAIATAVVHVDVNVTQPTAP